MGEIEQKAYIFGAIFALSNRLQVLGDAFDQAITIKQWLFLVSVSKFPAPPTVSEAAGVIGYSRQNAKRIATALEDRGFVTITRDGKDSRALRIALTQTCRAYFAARQEREMEFLEQVFAGFDTKLTAGFYEGLLRLEENLGRMEKKYEALEE